MGWPQIATLARVLSIDAGIGRSGMCHRRWVERAPLDFCSPEIAALVRLGLSRLALLPTGQARP